MLALLLFLLIAFPTAQSRRFHDTLEDDRSHGHIRDICRKPIRDHGQWAKYCQRKGYTSARVTLRQGLHFGFYANHHKADTNLCGDDFKDVPDDVIFQVFLNKNCSFYWQYSLDDDSFAVEVQCVFDDFYENFNSEFHNDYFDYFLFLYNNEQHNNWYYHIRNYHVLDDYLGNYYI